MERPSPEGETGFALEELELLAQTAGATVLSTIIQKKVAPDPAYYIGPGKAREVAALVNRLGADLVIFNDELSPTQVRNLDQLLGVKTIDRTALILDIFARRARSRAGKLQVELAQLQYLLPRLIGLGHRLSRLGGGIGTRGPGETQLEIDRRVIRHRIGELRREIAALRRHRSLHRQQRRRNRLTVAALVGYTNAGKSTLLNALTGADLYTEDKLFATLDSSVRRGILQDGRTVLFLDTVGFIHHLPRQLVTAFQATLEEIGAADILLHVVDINHHHYLDQIAIVREHLSRIEPDFYRRELLVFNKVDLSNNGPGENFLQREFPGACFVSGLTGAGLAELKTAVARVIDHCYKTVKAYLPYCENALFHQIRRSGSILAVDYQPGYLAVEARVDPGMADRLYPYANPPAADPVSPRTEQAEREAKDA